MRLTTVLHFAASHEQEDSRAAVSVCLHLCIQFNFLVTVRVCTCEMNIHAAQYCTVCLHCCLRVWLSLKGWTVFIQENGSAYCSLGNELLNQALHSQHHMWKEPDWSWATLRMESKQCDWIRKPLLSWNLESDWLLPDGLWCTWVVCVMCAGCK